MVSSVIASIPNPISVAAGIAFHQKEGGIVGTTFCSLKNLLTSVGLYEYPIYGVSLILFSISDSR